MFRGARLVLRMLLTCIPILAPAEDVTEPAEGPALPLENRRSISFETDEGTWVSLDVAPDGKSLVFDLLGDIYSLDMKGGAARPLLTGLAFESQPVFSPDGSQIAFVSDRGGSTNVWVANRDGTSLKQITQSKEYETYSTPAWSATGDFIFVARPPMYRGVHTLWMYHVKGGSGIQIMPRSPEQSMNVMDAAASPDGKYLYYSLKNGDAWVGNPMRELRRHDFRTGAEEVVLTSSGGVIRPVLSPDGRYLAYGTRIAGETGLRLRTLDTGEDRLLAYPVQLDQQEVVVPSLGLLPGYDFTPDGREIIVAYGGKINRIDIETRKVTNIPFKARVDLAIGPSLRVSQTDPTGPVRARIIQTPQQSPDGQRLAFSALGRIYVTSLDERAPTKPMRLTQGDVAEFEPVWSPDGQWIAYVSWSNEAGGRIWKMRANGRGMPQRLTEHPAYYHSPAFSPDGKQIVALRASTDDRVRSYEQRTFQQVQDIIHVPVNGGPDRQIIAVMAVGSGDILSAPAATSDPRNLHFGKEPQSVYFYAEGKLQSVRLDGLDRRELVKITAPVGWDGSAIPAEAVRISRDGKWALALLGSQLYVVSVPAVGGDAPVVDLSSSVVPFKKLTDMGADYLDLADGGRTITWALGSTFYRRSFDDIAFDNVTFSGMGQTESFAVVVEVPRDMPEGAIVLRGATAITMKGDEVIENADILIEGNRIKAIGREGTIEIPARAEIRDISGRYVSPGFVDTHHHSHYIRRGVLDMHPWNLAADLAYGVTAGLDPDGHNTDMFVYQDLIDAGQIIGPRGYNTGRLISSSYRFHSEDEVRAVLRKFRDHYRTRNIKSYLVGNRQQRQWMVNASRELGMMPTTEGADDMGLDVTHVIDGFFGNEHLLPVVPLYDDVAQLYARSGIGYSLTLAVGYGYRPSAFDDFKIKYKPYDDPKVNRFVPHFFLEENTLRVPWAHENQHTYPRYAEGAAKIFRAGGRVGLGSHGDFPGIGYHWDMQALASGGLSAHEVLQIATRVSSEVIGREAELGTLEVGKYADLVIFERNPMEEIRNTLSLSSVMKNGRLYDSDTLDEVWPRKKEYQHHFTSPLGTGN